MRLHVCRAAALLLVSAASCKRAPPEPPVANRPTLAYTTPWKAAQRDSFYHLTEGSEVIPTFVVRALLNPATGRPILADPQRYGLIVDPDHPDMAVGVTNATTADSRLFGIKMFGFNCSACHVAQIQYRGKTLQVDGAPSHFDADTFRAELTGAMEWMLADPVRIIQLVGRALRESPEAAPLFTAGGGTVEASLAVHERLRPDSAPPAGDTAHANFVRRLHALLAEEAARTGISHGEGLGGRDDDRADRELRARYTALHDSARIAAVTGTRPNAPAALARKIHPDERRAEADLQDYVEDLVVGVRLFRDRLRALKEFTPAPQHQQPPSLPHTPSGPGRVDAFGVARNLIYPNDPVPVTAPVSYPWLWGFTLNAWLHYDANTNSVMERNMGQAMGVGAVFDPYTAQSTLRPVEIHRLEILARHIQPPRWPVEMFGPLDPAKQRDGEAIFNRECARCHFNGSGEVPFDSVYEPWYVGTDSTRIVNFAAPLGDTSMIAGRPSRRLNPGPNFTAVVGPLLTRVKTQAYRLFSVPPAMRDSMNDCPSDTVWRTTRAWQSRPLSGIWATAPYLHNGSVPTLYDLLRPAAERPDSFFVGNPEYDPVKLGYVSAPAAGRLPFVFRTSQPGNGNGGHEYGTQLGEDERMALLEYLKGHTLPVNTQPTQRQCGRGPGTAPPGRVPPRRTR
jgi:cytochrome c5